ncbi:MAG: glutathione synthase [Sandaracinaceae bacterium]|nr:glutathione synthase [Sandaracinaceae bacterium]
MRLLVVMDPPETVLVDADTSFALMEEAQARGHRVDHCLITDLFATADPATGERRAGARIRRASMFRDPALAPITLGAPERVWLDEVDAVLMRKDPPFDANYLWATQVLELARGKTLLVNDPRGLRDANEKLYALHFPAQMPATLVSSDKDDIKAFLHAHGGKVVLKPLSGAGGDGVFLLRGDDLNVNAIIETVTQVGRRMAMVQEFLPDVVRGDKRVLLLDGEPLGGILRVPRKDDVRSNIHVGGTVEKAPLDEHDLRIVRALRDKLREDGLVFVGLDVIGGRLTEVNVTSPTGIQQMSRLDGVNLSAKVIDWIEARARR